MNLSVEVRGYDIIVSQLGTSHCVTYRRDPSSQMLGAICTMRCDPDSETLRFLRQSEDTGLALRQTFTPNVSFRRAPSFTSIEAQCTPRLNGGNLMA
jgi:hypothetical protein